MKISNGTLVLVADGSKLLLFRNEGDEKFPVLETLAHEVADNPPTSEQGADRPGRSFSSSSDRRSAYGDTDWHQQSEDDFARHAAGILEKAAQQEGGVPVIVAAAPRTLGELRKHYGRETQSRLQGEIAKDLANQETDGIIKVIVAQPEA
ncbi:MAG TPA: host attachment family protein [Sphingomonadaceae bacterium]|nr:host attachment family protein [Sphingomonadaceae bacterium]